MGEISPKSGKVEGGFCAQVLLAMPGSWFVSCAALVSFLPHYLYLSTLVAAFCDGWSRFRPIADGGGRERNRTVVIKNGLRFKQGHMGPFVNRTWDGLGHTQKIPTRICTILLPSLETGVARAAVSHES